MTEAMKAILELGFIKLGLTTVEAYTQSYNSASTSLLGKFGFRLIGDRKDASNKLNTVFTLTAEVFLGQSDVQHNDD